MEDMVAVVMQQNYGANIAGEVCGFRKDIAEDLVKRKIAAPYEQPKAEKQETPKTEKQEMPRVNKQETGSANKGSSSFDLEGNKR